MCKVYYVVLNLDGKYLFNEDIKWHLAIIKKETLQGFLNNGRVH